MDTPQRRSRPAIDRSREAVLAAVTAILIERPEASLAEVAALVGIGRTTLHRMFATREDLLAAVALDAIEHVAGMYERVGIPDAFTPGAAPDDSWAAFSRLATELVPLGPRLMYLLRADELDTESDVSRPMEQLDAVLEGAIQRAQDRGAIRRHASANWLMESFYALTYLAWEQVRDGKLASRDAADLIMESWRHGVAAD